MAKAWMFMTNVTNKTWQILNRSITEFPPNPASLKPNKMNKMAESRSEIKSYNCC